MRGYWLDRSTGIFATQKTPYQFDKLARTLNRKGQNKNKKFFIPQFECTEDFKSKNIPCQQFVDNDVIDQLVANVDFTGNDPEEDSLNRELKEARKAKILQQTKLISQKLEQRKKLLFAEWSEKFFDQFSNHFGKLRNCLVNMRLNEEQVKVFNQTLQSCINNLQLSLDNIWQEFTQEKQDE